MSELKPCPFCGSAGKRLFGSERYTRCTNNGCYLFLAHVPNEFWDRDRPIEISSLAPEAEMPSRREIEESVRRGFHTREEHGGPALMAFIIQVVEHVLSDLPDHVVVRKEKAK